jgi:putative transposase
MPRANRHILPGHSYHVTHRCHDRAFLLKFARDRQAYRSWLRRGLARHDISLLTYCITSNHVHLLLRAETTDELASFMQYVQGNSARAYNKRKSRVGAFWSDRYHATMIEDGMHLWRCLRYIDLNMIRAGVVGHPGEWEWTGWKELMGERTRNRLLNLDALVSALNSNTIEKFRTSFQSDIKEHLACGRPPRESCWSEAVAIGSPDFVAGIEKQLRSDYTRKSMSIEHQADSLWVLRETTAIYKAENTIINRPISVFSRS